MKNFILVSPVLVLLTFACGLLVCSDRTKDETTASETHAVRENKNLLTAREAFAIAENVAKDWSSDAALVNLSTYPSAPKSSGRGSCWKLEFNSLIQEKKLEVSVRRGKFFQKMEGKFINRDATSDGWIDSPEAILVALERCGKTSDEKYWFGLSAEEGIPAWYIKCYKTGEEPTWVKVNALSGEEMKTWTGR